MLGCENLTSMWFDQFDASCKRLISYEHEPVNVVFCSTGEASKAHTVMLYMDCSMALHEDVPVGFAGVVGLSNSTGCTLEGVFVHCVGLQECSTFPAIHM